MKRKEVDKGAALDGDWKSRVCWSYLASKEATRGSGSCQTRRVQGGASPRPMPPQSMGLHLPCTSKSRAGIITAHIALIQHTEMLHSTASGSTSSVPAWSWHDTDLNCFHRHINPHCPPTLPAGSADFADAVPQTAPKRLQSEGSPGSPVIRIHIWSGRRGN